MPVTLYFPNKMAPTQTVVLRAGVASITRKERAAVGQVMHVAASGREYVEKITPNETDVWPMDLFYLPTDDESPTAQGKTTLEAFITGTLDYMMHTCEIEDAEGNTIIARYVRGLTTLREAGQPGDTTRAKDQWFGTITWRKTL